MAGKKQSPTKYEGPKEEEEEDEDWAEDPGDVELDEEAANAQAMRLRDWRDVEKYREQRELKRLIDDDFGLDEIEERHSPQQKPQRRRRR